MSDPRSKSPYAQPHRPVRDVLAAGASDAERLGVASLAWSHDGRAAAVRMLLLADDATDRQLAFLVEYGNMGRADAAELLGMTEREAVDRLNNLAARVRLAMSRLEARNGQRHASPPRRSGVRRAPKGIRAGSGTPTPHLASGADCGEGGGK